MSEFVAGAFVDVRPDAKGFRSDLKKQVDASIKSMGTFKIPVELDPKRFKSTVNAAARQSPAKIPIVPGTSAAELRRSIKDKIDRATSGLKITVPVEVQATGAGSRGGGQAAPKAAASGASAATTAGNNAAAASTEKLTAAKQRQSAVDAALKRSSDQLLISQRLFAAAEEEGASAEEKAIRLREARAAASRAARATNDLLATSQGKLTAAQQTALEASNMETTTFRQSVIEKQKDLNLTTAQAGVMAKSAKTRALAVVEVNREVASIKSLNTLHLQENELLAVEARLKAQTNRARELGLAAIAAENELMLAQIAIQKAAIVDQRTLLKGESTRQRQQKTAGRGAASTILSLLGVRGATLAANASFLVGAAGAALFAKSVQSFASLETELNVFQATASATADQMREVSDAAKELGADISLPGVSAADAAQSMSELARAGLNVRDSIAGARGVLELAAAAQISNSEAAQITASALNAFSLAGEDAVRVADLLANAANASQGSIQDFAAAMQQALTIANLVGFTLNDTVATLTLFARNGLKGSDAGTSLRTALSRLIAPTKKASDLIAALGLNLRDANGNLRADIFAQFGEATKNLSPALRDMIAQTIAGQDAIRAFAIGSEEGRRGLKLAQLQMESTGSAAALAAARAKGLGGSFRALGSNVETLGTQLGGFVAGPIQETVGGLNDLITQLNLLAHGDFEGFGRSIGDDLAAIGRGARRSVDDLAGFGKDIIERDPVGALKNLNDLRDVGADDERKEIVALREELASLQAIRVEAFKAGGIDIKPFTKKIEQIRTQLRAARVDAGEIIPVTKTEKALAPLQDLFKQAQELRKQLSAKGDDTSFVDSLLSDLLVKMNKINVNAVEQAKKLKKDMANATKGTDIADSFKAQFDLIAGNIDLATPEVLAGLEQLATRIKGAAPLTGAAGKQVGEALMKSITAAIRAAVEEDNPELAESLRALAAKIANLFGVSVAEEFKNIKVPLTEEDVLAKLLPERIASARAEAFGTVADQIVGKKAELAGLQKSLDDVIKGSADEEAILQAIAAKKNEIRSLREGQASDQKEADAASDKKVANAQSAEEQRLQNKLTIAQQTETLKDDIKRQLDLKAFYQRQIATIRATVRDAETRREALEEAEQNLFDIEQDIAGDRAERRAQIRDVALDKLDEAEERAGESESLADDLKIKQRKVRFWKAEVRNLKELVKERKATADELKEAQEALDDAEDEARQARRARRDQRNEQREESFQLDITFAQTTENRNLEIRARTAFIKFLDEQIRAAKGNTLKIKQLRNEKAEQNKALKELEGEAKEGSATTAFELLQQAAETFKRTGGNLIGGDQPFAGPAGFTADMAQFLRRQAKSSASASTATPGGKAPISGALDRNDQAHFKNLTNAVVDLTDAIRNPGEGKTKPRVPNATGPAEGRSRRHYVIATESRNVVERRSGI